MSTICRANSAGRLCCRSDPRDYIHRLPIPRHHLHRRTVRPHRLSGFPLMASNQAVIVRGTARTFQASITGAVGTETLKLVIGNALGQAGQLVIALVWDADDEVFACTLTAAQTSAMELGTYSACVWRTDTGFQDVVVMPGGFTFVDAVLPS